MYTPAHLAASQPTVIRQGTIYLKPGQSIEALLPTVLPAPDRHDEIFAELVRLRRHAIRLKWWQFSERRRIDNEIIALKAEQDALSTLDRIVSQYKAEAGL